MFNVLRPWNSKGRIWKAYEYYDYPPKRSSLSSFPRYRYNREVRIARYHCSVRYNNDNHVSTNIVSIFNNYLSVVYTLLRVIRRYIETTDKLARYLYRQNFFFSKKKLSFTLFRTIFFIRLTVLSGIPSCRQCCSMLRSKHDPENPRCVSLETIFPKDRRNTLRVCILAGGRSTHCRRSINYWIVWPMTGDGCPV